MLSVLQSAANARRGCYVPVAVCGTSNVTG
jgi:hypothetical protein